MNKHRGFTVVELIVIISVIGILVGIVAIAWPNYMKQTQDAKRKNDVQQIASALDVYAFQKNALMTTGSNCGKNNNGNGFVSLGGGTSGYTTSILSCLQAIKALPNEPLTDPSGCIYDSGGDCSVPVRAYMKATCTKGTETVTYVLAHLETEPRIDSEVNALCNSGTVAGFSAAEQLWGSLYGMNYYVKVN